jgi:hypothetical protein
MRIKMALTAALIAGSTMGAQAGGLAPAPRVVQDEIVVAPTSSCGLICAAPLLLIPFLIPESTSGSGS